MTTRDMDGDCRDCRSVAERLTRYVDGSLPGEECAALERHLASCPPCRDEAGEEAAGRRLLRECAERLRAEPMPPALRSRCEALCRDCKSDNPLARWWRSLFR